MWWQHQRRGYVAAPTPAKIALIVRCATEAGLTIVAALHDVEQNAVKLNSRAARRFLPEKSLLWGALLHPAL